MTLRLSSVLSLVLCALLCGSCSSKKSDLLRRTEPPDIARLIQRVTDSHRQVRSLAGNGSVSFETPDLGGSVYFRVALKKPDSVLIRFEGPFGMDVGFLFLSPQRYVMYSSIENQVTSGVPTSGNIRSLIPFDLTYEQIVNAFAGAFPVPPDSTIPQSSVWDGSSYVLTYLRGIDTCEYWIDGSTYQVTRYQVRDTAGAIVVDAEAGRFYQDDEMLAPRLVTVSFPRERRQVSIYYSSLVLNPSTLSFAYSVPTGARRKTQP